MNGAHLRQLTIRDYEDPPATSQDPAFTRVQEGSYAKHPAEAALLERVALRLAAESGREGFTAEDVLDEAGGREHFPKNLIGAVIGHLRSRHAICKVGREKGRSPYGKGRWVNRFALNGDAIEVAA